MIGADKEPLTLGRAYKLSLYGGRTGFSATITLITKIDDTHITYQYVGVKKKFKTNNPSAFIMNLAQ